MATTSTQRRIAPATRTRRRNMVGVDDATHATLRALAAKLDISIQEAAAIAIEQYRRQRMLEETNRIYAELRANPIRWQEELDERAIWDVTLADGLVDE